MKKSITKKSITLRNGEIIEGNHYTKQGITYCENGLSVENKLITKKNGRKTIYG